MSFYALAGWLTYPLVRFVLRGRWTGTENVPAAGGAVVASNHLSNADGFALGHGVFPRRQLRFMAKVELFRRPFAPVIRGLGGFPVDRANPGRAALATAVDLCRMGELVVMFPEGTRRGRGSREPTPHVGAARIALRAGVPLIPAAIAGTDRLRRLGPVRIAFGAPIDLEDLHAFDRKAAARIATDRLMAAIAHLESSL